ncbi:hypothetical protein NPIL_570561 [Nephila pilipes]|uniref:Uncharacterized protein n=1 Tax=Nephila pilipes TaxID=299642 RepID=A0A8X6UNI9_NEPPI|nr:hypothetical protein NPIL_570561 [Nephila pilipes]
MARHRYYGNFLKVNSDEIQKPTPDNGFKYFNKNTAQPQWISKTYSQNHLGGRKRISVPERTTFQNIASNFYNSRRLPRFRELPKRFNLFKNSNPPNRFREQPKRFELFQHSNPPNFNMRSSRTHLRPPEPTLTTLTPLIPQVASNPSTAGYYMLLIMFLLLLMYLLCYWWNRKNKKDSVKYIQLPRSRILVDYDNYSIQSERFSIPSSPTFESEPETEESVILNLADMDTLPEMSVLTYNGFKPTPIIEKETTAHISNLFSEEDFIRHYLTETSTTYDSKSEQQESTFGHTSPETRAKKHSIGIINPADYSSSEQETTFGHSSLETGAKKHWIGVRNPADYSNSQSSSAQERPNFPQLLKSVLSTSSSRQQESSPPMSFKTWNSKEISLNFQNFLPDVEYTFPQRDSHQGQTLSYPYLSHHTKEENHRILHSDPCLPYSTNEKSDPISSSEESPPSSGYTTAVSISADVKIPPPADPSPSAKNLKRLLFPSMSSSDSEPGEEEIIFLHSPDCPPGKTVPSIRIATISEEKEITSPEILRPGVRTDTFPFPTFTSSEREQGEEEIIIFHLSEYSLNGAQVKKLKKLETKLIRQKVHKELQIRAQEIKFLSSDEKKKELILDGFSGDSPTSSGSDSFRGTMKSPPRNPTSSVKNLKTFRFPSPRSSSDGERGVEETTHFDLSQCPLHRTLVER